MMAGIDIGGTTWSVGVPVPGGVNRTAGGTTGGTAGTVEALTRDLRVDALGCSFPGEVDDEGVVRAWPNNPSWIGFPLRNALMTATGATEVRIVDDGFAAAFGESRAGVAVDLPDHLAITLGTGVGGTLVISHQPRTPRGAAARTVGHWRVLGTDRPCRCGQAGCLQLALDTVPGDGQAVDAQAWPDGPRFVEVVADVATTFDVPAVVLTGGRMNDAALRGWLVEAFTAAGLDCRVPPRPSDSSLLGATRLVGVIPC